MSTETTKIFELFVRDEDGCPTRNDFDGGTNLRVLALFIILISSALGVFFPLVSVHTSRFFKVPSWCWFIAKFFGSGVIIATGFIHLLEPAADALGDECLGGTFEEYPWAYGICLMSLFVVFFGEIIAQHYMSAATQVQVHSHDIENEHSDIVAIDEADNNDANSHSDEETNIGKKFSETHVEVGSNVTDNSTYANQLLSVFVLEFGIIFHSVFIGLSLAVAGDEFHTLFPVLVFHQMFEGLGLGTRIAETPWEQTSHKRYTPWMLGLAFALTTPVAVAIGIGVRHSFVPGGRTALIVNGCFDAISAGILLYTGLVELMAHEFLYSTEFKGSMKRILWAYFVMCWGAGLMALLGKWA